MAKMMNRKVPMRMIIHILLMLTTTALILVQNVEDAGYYISARQAFMHYFYPEDFDFGTYDWNVYDIKDVVANVKRSVSNFYNLPDISVDYYELLKDDKGAIIGPELKVVQYQDFDKALRTDTMHLNDVETKYYSLNEQDLGPLQDKTKEELRRFFEAIVYLKMEMKMKNYAITSFSSSCLVWDVNVYYHFENRGVMRLDLEQFVSGTCDEKGFEFGAILERFMWLNALVFIFAIWNIILMVRWLMRSIKLFSQVIQWQQQSTKDPNARVLVDNPNMWKKLTNKDKLHFFNIWFFITNIANICLIIVSVMNIINFRNRIPTETLSNFLLGTGCACLYFSLVRFLESRKAFYVLVLTLWRGIPRVMKFMVGVAPVMLGYAWFGVAYFGFQSDCFRSFTDSMVTLFAVLNGDVIRDTYVDIMYYAPVVSQIYLYSFICLFIYVILNSFVAIVQEAFMSTLDEHKIQTFLSVHGRDETANKGINGDDELKFAPGVHEHIDSFQVLTRLKEVDDLLERCEIDAEQASDLRHLITHIQTVDGEFESGDDNTVISEQEMKEVSIDSQPAIRRSKSMTRRGVLLQKQKGSARNLGTGDAITLMELRHTAEVDAIKKAAEKMSLAERTRVLASLHEVHHKMLANFHLHVAMVIGSTSGSASTLGTSATPTTTGSAQK
eukprot:TRINITY_DN8907_c0_g1_i1.p1 TRINITY_DN8907_c0_g1~~TRINITY_DN8907_c0_g1_i1.p1  ORF type:complete len:669 (-),score=188.98 TRINITY_DN8907_c0_g1_i1:111-2117(-)